MPRSMHLHTEIYPNLKSMSELFKMYMKILDSFRLYNLVSCNQTLGCLRLYGDSRVSRAQPRINALELLLQHDWFPCLFCFPFETWIFKLLKLFSKICLVTVDFHPSWEFIITLCYNWEFAPEKLIQDFICSVDTFEADLL